MSNQPDTTTANAQRPTDRATVPPCVPPRLFQCVVADARRRMMRAGRVSAVIGEQLAEYYRDQREKEPA